MPRFIAPLSDLSVRQLKTPGLHSVGGATGLKLQISKSGTKSWILRTTIANKVCDIGLGSYPTITLKTARELARGNHSLLQQGIDPILERRTKKDSLALERSNRQTFTECMDSCIKLMEAKWQNPKSHKQWVNSLNTYVLPTIGSLPVADVHTGHVLTILEPIWAEKPETASRVRGRIEKILAYATTKGCRHGDNPAKLKGHLDSLLPETDKLKKNNHLPALDYEDIGAFVQELRAVKGVAARALELSILTGTRSGEVRGAQWDEIDLKAKLWTIPAERMKANKQHVIPLSNQAIKLLQNVDSSSSYVFPGLRGKVMSDMSLSKIVKGIHKRSLAKGELGFTDKYSNDRVVTPHGFRSTFRDWAGEQSSFPREVIEHALAHQLSDKAEAAYQRKTSIPKRIKLMQAWANHCDVNLTSRSNNVSCLNTHREKAS